MTQNNCDPEREKEYGTINSSEAKRKGIARDCERIIGREKGTMWIPSRASGMQSILQLLCKIKGIFFSFIPKLEVALLIRSM